jgi:hypothetical protein
MYVLLGLNGLGVEAEETEVVELMVVIAAGQCSESEVVAWLRQHTARRRAGPRVGLSVKVPGTVVDVFMSIR